jgi:hypothetical protein
VLSDTGSPIVISSKTGDVIEAKVLERRYPSGSKSDREWLSVTVSLRIGPFSGHFDADWRLGFIAGSKERIRRLYDDLEGSALFEPDWELSLSMNFTGDGMGHFRVDGKQFPGELGAGPTCVSLFWILIVQTCGQSST